MIGLVGTATAVVTEGVNTAKAVGSGSLDVFATPMMVALMEKAACECIAKDLEAGQTSVGTEVNVAHVAASAVGATITATATVTGIDGRKIEFALTASEGAKEIGSGTHTRFVVDAQRFMGKLLNM